MRRLSNRSNRIILALGLLGILGTARTAWAQADLVLHNARIYTVDAAQPQAEAMAVGQGRILMVGINRDVLAAYPDAERVDAGGRAVVPGFIDAHAHLMGLGISMLQADLVGTQSKDEVIARLQAFEQALPEGAWLTGRGWDQNDWPEQAFPTRHDLDEAFPSRPVWLERIDGHASWANTAAVRLVGEEVLRAMPDPEGGKIVRDARGEPTGVFVDAAAAIIDAKRPRHSAEERKKALRLALEQTRQYGLTGVHDAGVDLATLALYKQAIDEGWFDLRLYGMIGGRGATFDHYCERGPVLSYKDRLTVRAVKYYIDGALGSRGAALLADYADDPGNRGLLQVAPERFYEDVKRAMECGFQVNTHAIGDRGNRVALDAYARAMQATGDSLGRHRVEHAQVVAPEDLARFGQLGVIASMQPTHATSDMYWAEARVGPARVRGAYAWRTILETGGRLAFGSDFPVEHVDPLRGFYAAVTRQDAEGYPEGGWHPEQALSREEALRAFTLDAAYAAFQEDVLGSLTPGKLADFVVLDRDIMAVPPEELLEAQVYSVYLGGRRIYAVTM